MSGTEQPVHPDDVAASTGGAYWSVEEARWVRVAPSLPPELADLLAPPVVIGAATA